MKYFKDSQNKLHAIEDIKFLYLLPSDCVEITEDEYIAINETIKDGIKNTQYTALEFLDRFTETEQLAVVSATLANAQVKLWYDKLLAASFVDLADPRVEAGLASLVLAGLLTSERKDEILTP